ncbi:MAG: 3-phosphoshikimate 1-carboxyvinyltransferase [Saprospiraceae bacterium]|nr:3-phosphoshikimate 1-carboxyvinyltransferase [Saprospiraceae bacterium]
MEILRLSKPDRSLRGHLALDGSKSLSNRALIALALAGVEPANWLSNLSTSKDTRTLQRLLGQASSPYDAGDAGTTFRFLTAYLALQPGVQILTGSARMQQRPVGALVQALRSLGADIRFLEKEGYPPLQIGELATSGSVRRSIRVQADVSSQFLSALLLIAPYLPGGLELIPEGALVSKPYLEMTLRMMRYFGATVDWQGDNIVVQPGGYQPRMLRIEADWSAASYWYALAAFGEDVDLTLEGLFADSWQGDAVLATMMQTFGVQTQIVDPTPSPSPGGEGSRLSGSNSPLPPWGGAGGGVNLRRDPAIRPAEFRWNFLECPDIAQTLAVVCAGLGVPGEFSGLETLAIKETDRTAALQTELAKIGVSFGPVPGSAAYRVEGAAAWAAAPHFASYGDHRMAMSFAPLAMFAPIGIEHPAVVAKSYPMFWDHLALVGFQCEKQKDHAS